MTKQQRLTVVISILASFVAFLDGSVVNVALPAITKELGGRLITQQWVVDAYLITLSALILLAGALADIFGRKKILFYGLIGFAVTSILCAIAPSAAFLIIARALQGVAGALLVPSSLAIIVSVFSGAAQGKAIGTWTAWTGIAFIIGPLLGGLLVDTSSWRLIFAINVIPIVVTLWLLESLKLKEPATTNRHLDLWGAFLCVVGLTGTVYALIQQSHYGWGSPSIYLPLIGGVAMLIIFLWHESHTKTPMLPLSLFKIHNFSAGNISTVFIYAGLSIATFLITIFLQQVGGYSAIASGMALLPITLLMFVLSPRFGAQAGKYGPRLFMTLGPIIAGLGFLTMVRVNTPVQYWSELFPGVLIFGLGLSMTVAPLTSAVLGSISSDHAGIASAINNAISRIAGLVAIASIGIITGTAITVSSFHDGVIAMAVLLIIGGLTSAIGIRNHSKKSSPHLLNN
jgi:EmrB/QacA subfamily drug resistance transporter